MNILFSNMRLDQIRCANLFSHVGLRLYTHLKSLSGLKLVLVVVKIKELDTSQTLPVTF